MEKFADKVGTQVRRPGLSVANTGLEACAPGVLQEPKPSTTPLAIGVKRWAVAEGRLFWGAPETQPKLPAGFYRTATAPNIGPTLVKQDLQTDNLLELPDDATSSIIHEFKTFWSVRETFKRYGYLHKRGFLLWGPPGSGKTSCLQLLIKQLIEKEQGIVVAIDNPHEAAACLQLVRQIEPLRPMICILEDFDALVERNGEHHYLGILDGEAQVDNVCFVGTTNYPERLDKRFVDRPSRFDTIMYIGMPSAAARRAYFQAKDEELRTDAEALDYWVSQSKGFSLAHLKEMIIAVRCFGQDIDDVVKRLEEMHERQPTSEDTPDMAPAGFLGRAHANGAHA